MEDVRRDAVRVRCGAAPLGLKPRVPVPQVRAADAELSERCGALLHAGMSTLLLLHCYQYTTSRYSSEPRWRQSGELRTTARDECMGPQRHLAREGTPPPCITVLY